MDEAVLEQFAKNDRAPVPVQLLSCSTCDVKLPYMVGGGGMSILCQNTNSNCMCSSASLLSK